jgi:hypothetical protein
MLFCPPKGFLALLFNRKRFCYQTTYDYLILFVQGRSSIAEGKTDLFLGASKLGLKVHPGCWPHSGGNCGGHRYHHLVDSTPSSSVSNISAISHHNCRVTMPL